MMAIVLRYSQAADRIFGSKDAPAVRIYVARTNTLLVCVSRTKSHTVYQIEKKE